MTISLVVLFAGLVVGTFGYDLLRRYAPSVVGSSEVALTLTVAIVGARALRLPAIRVLPPHRTRGSPGGRCCRERSSARSCSRRRSRRYPCSSSFATDVAALRALGTTFLLLVWLYVMANVIVFGAALNYVAAYGQTASYQRPARPRRMTTGRLPPSEGRRQGARRRGRDASASRLPVVAELARRCARRRRGRRPGRSRSPPSPRGAPGDRALEDPAATTTSSPSGADRDDHADVARRARRRRRRAPPASARRVVGRPAGRVTPGRPSRRSPRSPSPRRRPTAPGSAWAAEDAPWSRAFSSNVSPVSGGGSSRPRARSTRPARERAPQLLELVRVPAREARPHARRTQRHRVTRAQAATAPRRPARCAASSSAMPTAARSSSSVELARARTGRARRSPAPRRAGRPPSSRRSCRSRPRESSA